MSKGDFETSASLGFLTVVEHEQHGLFGGYLVLNTAGRPIEFHCTAPIKANRAQQILYGPTLEPFLYGEQIGGTLLAKADSEPLTVCTDCMPALALREHTSLPVALVLPEESESLGDERILRTDAAHNGMPELKSFQLGRNKLALPETRDNDRTVIAERLGGLAESFDLMEPFGRIREAIEEAQQGVR